MTDETETSVKTEELSTFNQESEEKKLDIISNIPLEMTCVLGSTNMTVNQLLKLSKGSVIELDKYIGEPIDLLVNGKLVAKGEVVIVEDRIGITLTEIVREIASV